MRGWDRRLVFPKNKGGEITGHITLPDRGIFKAEKETEFASMVVFLCYLFFVVLLVFRFVNCCPNFFWYFCAVYLNRWCAQKNAEVLGTGHEFTVAHNTTAGSPVLDDDVAIVPMGQGEGLPLCR